MGSSMQIMLWYFILKCRVQCFYVVHHASLPSSTWPSCLCSPPPCHLVLLCMIFSFLAGIGEFRTESMDLRSILPIFVVRFLVLSELVLNYGTCAVSSSAPPSLFRHFEFFPTKDRTQAELSQTA